jgi:hypothetical protein
MKAKRGQPESGQSRPVLMKQRSPGSGSRTLPRRYRFAAEYCALSNEAREGSSADPVDIEAVFELSDMRRFVWILMEV